MERKLASIRRIESVEPIPGADNIEMIRVDGWELVTQKSNNFKVGDLVCYLEIDSFLPVIPQFEFLRKGCYKNTENLGEGFRIKTIKLRGQVSQGLALPLSDIAKILNAPIDAPLLQEEGADLTAYLGVKKYEQPIPAQLAGKVKGNFPSFIPKTDSERAQNLLKHIEPLLEDNFEVTTKLDGSSMTVYCRSHPDLSEPEIGVCSRNYNITEDDTNAFWKCARAKKIIDALLQLHKTSGAQLAFQGELVGPGVQKNKEKLTELDFYLFNVYDITLKRYLTPAERQALVSGIKSFLKIDINHVPIVLTQKLSAFLNNPTNRQELMQSLIAASKGPMMNGNGYREGVVFKHGKSDFNFKVINPDYLLKYDE
jgi:RNA ligase (TIGR02306 family)